MTTRCAGRFKTSSYSRNRAMVTSGTTTRSATKPRSAALAPWRLRNAATITEVSSTMRHICIWYITSHGMSMMRYLNRERPTRTVLKAFGGDGAAAESAIICAQ